MNVSRNCVHARLNPFEAGLVAGPHLGRRRAQTNVALSHLALVCLERVFSDMLHRFRRADLLALKGLGEAVVDAYSEVGGSSIKSSIVNHLWVVGLLLRCSMGVRS